MDSKPSFGRFLFEVLYLAITAFGGPNVHMALYLKRLVQEKGWLSEAELLELNALCQLLPGPTSTQTLVAIAYRRGGPVLAFWTQLIWVIPAVCMMSLLVLFLDMAKLAQWDLSLLDPIIPASFGFIIYAAWKLGRKAATDVLSTVLMLASALLMSLFPFVWIPPVLMLSAALIVILRSAGWKHGLPSIASAHWGYLIAFVLLLGFSILQPQFTDSIFAVLFAKFFKYGSLVFGGGQVLIPFMYTDLVQELGWLEGDDFLFGFGIVQSIPGPVFSFSAFAGGMAARPFSTEFQLLAAAISALGVFLPGFLLIFFVYPVWEQLRQHPMIKSSLKGLVAAAAGLVISAVYLIGIQMEWNWQAVLICSLAALAMLWDRIPALLILILALLMGYFIYSF